jgi:hypothetical protein
MNPPFTKCHVDRRQSATTDQLRVNASVTVRRLKMARYAWEFLRSALCVAAFASVMFAPMRSLGLRQLAINHDWFVFAVMALAALGGYIIATLRFWQFRCGPYARAKIEIYRHAADGILKAAQFSAALERLHVCRAIIHGEIPRLFTTSSDYIPKIRSDNYETDEQKQVRDTEKYWREHATWLASGNRFKNQAHNFDAV